MPKQMYELIETLGYEHDLGRLGDLYDVDNQLIDITFNIANSPFGKGVQLGDGVIMVRVEITSGIVEIRYRVIDECILQLLSITEVL